MSVLIALLFSNREVEWVLYTFENFASFHTGHGEFIKICRQLFVTRFTRDDGPL